MVAPFIFIFIFIFIQNLKPEPTSLHRADKANALVYGVHRAIYIRLRIANTIIKIEP